MNVMKEQGGQRVEIEGAETDFMMVRINDGVFTQHIALTPELLALLKQSVNEVREQSVKIASRSKRFRFNHKVYQLPKRYAQKEVVVRSVSGKITGVHYPKSGATVKVSEVKL